MKKFLSLLIFFSFITITYAQTEDSVGLHPITIDTVTANKLDELITGGHIKQSDAYPEHSDRWMVTEVAPVDGVNGSKGIHIKVYDVNAAGENILRRRDITIWKIDGKWSVTGEYIYWNHFVPGVIAKVLKSIGKY